MQYESNEECFPLGGGGRLADRDLRRVSNANITSPINSAGDGKG